MAVKKITQIIESLKKELIDWYVVEYNNGESYDEFYKCTVGFAASVKEAKKLVASEKKRNKQRLTEEIETDDGIIEMWMTSGERYNIWKITEENFDADVLIRKKRNWENS